MFVNFVSLHYQTNNNNQNLQPMKTEILKKIEEIEEGLEANLQGGQISRAYQLELQDMLDELKLLIS